MAKVFLLPPMSRVAARFVFVFFLIINCILWSRSKYGRTFQQVQDHSAGLVKRMSHEPSQPFGYQVRTTSEEECRPRAFPAEAQCTHVQECHTSNTLLNVEYLRLYFCADVALRPFVFIGLVLWLVFLFSTLGISASDFFTPNLATIAQMLGLDENVAGVTLLAFGNGSPDVFSTFSAMRANSGSLALGELLGAATFIVSCVVGSVCIIKPFKVHRAPFLRDVGFFTIAVSLLLVAIWDGRISAFEAGAMIGLYVFYAIVVVVGSWWERRQERRRQIDSLIRNEYAEEPLFQRYTDEPTPHLTVTPTSPRSRAISAPSVLRIQTDVPSRRYTRSPSPSPSLGKLPSFSLVGALEFRDVVASLKKEASGSSLTIFESPSTPYAGGHYHRPASRSPKSTRQILPSNLDESVLNGLRLGPRQPPAADSEPGNLEQGGPNDYVTPHAESRHDLPYIMRTPASPSLTESNTEDEERLYAAPSDRQRVWIVLRQTFHTLFPTLSDFCQQSLLSKIAAVLAAPAVLCLTLTLPVVVTPYGKGSSSREKTVASEDGRLVEFEEEGQERVLIAEEEIEENLHQLQFTRWLMAVQCICGPLFCVKVLFDGAKDEVWYLVGTAVAGFTVAILTLIFSDRGDNMTARMARCSMGFIVAVVWIMAIADEVVNVLQTFGMIFGLSDAIIGLTIFAVGNSLADLVANMSVAAFAPMMGFSACFGGPMLNILLGVGISGSYVISQTAEPYDLKISRTLFASAFGLLFLLAATLVFVPLNDYFLTRRWGFLLICSYVVIMIINIIVEM